MKKYWQYALFAISATLSMATSVQAEEISTKAADLIATDSPSEVSNQRKESEQNNFSVAQKVNIENKLPEKNYWYVSGSGGLGFSRKINGSIDNEDDGVTVSAKGNLGVKSGSQGSIAVGYQWEKYRAELELNRSSNRLKSLNITGAEINGVEVDLNEFIVEDDDSEFNPSTPLNGSVKSTTVFVNGYYDIPTKSKLRPYVGAGVGLSFPSSTELSYDGDTGSFNSGKTALALQAKAGVQYEVTKKGNIFAEAKYRYVAGSSSDFGEGGRINYNATNSYSLNIGYRYGF